MSEFSRELNVDSFGEWDFVVLGEVGVLDVADEIAIIALEKRLRPGEIGGALAEPTFDN